MDLFPTYSTMKDRTGKLSLWGMSATPKVARAAWRVNAKATSDHPGGALPLGFGRKKDAECAIQSLINAGLPTAREIATKLDADGPESILRIMVEHLQW